MQEDQPTFLYEFLMILSKVYVVIDTFHYKHVLEQHLITTFYFVITIGKKNEFYYM